MKTMKTMKKRILSALLAATMLLTLIPQSVRAERDEIALDFMTYIFTARGADTDTLLTFEIAGYNGWPSHTAQSGVNSYGQVIFRFSDVGLSALGNPGFVQVTEGSEVTLTLESIGVNGEYSMLPTAPHTLQVGREGANGLPNQWSGVRAGDRLVAMFDGSAYFEFVADSGWTLFREQTLPDTTASISESASTSTPTVTPGEAHGRSIEYAVAMGNGWNLGNTLDSMGGHDLISWEQAWGNPVATRELIHSIKAKGFDHIRIPFTIHGRSTDNVIDPGWLARYRETVDWALEADLYVMVNIHHDSWYWLGRQHGGNPMGNPWNGDVSEPHFLRFSAYWQQLAELFADTDDRVMFETINEPEFNHNNGNPSAENQRRLDVINAAAIDIIRAVPGNENRMIVVPTWKTNHESQHSAAARDFILGRNDPNLMATVHYYSEWVFSNHLGRTIFDEPLYNQYDPNDTTSARDKADEFFEILERYFISEGIGVSVGEWGILGYDNDTDARGENVLQRGEELKYYEYMQYKARAAHGISLSFWDNGSGINRRQSAYPWNVPRVGEMLTSTVRSSYSAGLDTLYFREQPADDVFIVLRLNGNEFIGIEGISDSEYSYTNSVLRLNRDLFTESRTLVMQFSAGCDWHMHFIRTSEPVVGNAGGSRNGITIPIDMGGNHIRRVSAFRGSEIPENIGMIPGNESIRAGGNHASWWPYLEYGGAYSVSYADSTITLRNGFFNGINEGDYIVVAEFYDGTAAGINLSVTSDGVTASPGMSKQLTVDNGQVTVEPPDVSTPPTEQLTVDSGQVTVEPPTEQLTVDSGQLTVEPPDVSTPPTVTDTSEPPDVSTPPTVTDTSEPPTEQLTVDSGQLTVEPPESTTSVSESTTEGTPAIKWVVDDAIEILKFVVGLPSTATSGTVDDAIEILKWIVGLPSVWD
jgi:endoglucanase